MSKRVLDASVLIAIAKSESYHAGLLQIVEGAVLSTVNYAEVRSRLSDLGIDMNSPPVHTLFGLLSHIEPFTESQAQLTGDLHAETRSAGLSLGDRACLALALELGADVYTADHVWSKINLPCTIHLIR